ncbi:MAG: hypothetical protein K1X28_10280 [Parachlamydiales bacterium]|nr:hypothetical protein [Parachlamydiales bacterium]
MSTIMFSSPLETIQNTWGLVKNFFNYIEPYQPTFATFSILSKAAYKSNLRPTKERTIRNLENRLRVVKAIERDRRVPLEQSRAITYLLRKEATDQLHIRIALMQLASLGFQHPGSNFWNSSVTLFGRAASIEHYFKHTDHDPMNKIHGTLGIFSALGTGVALLKQIGVIAEYTPLCHGIIGLSFVSMAVETALMLKNWFWK